MFHIFTDRRATRQGITISCSRRLDTYLNIPILAASFEELSNFSCYIIRGESIPIVPTFCSFVWLTCLHYPSLNVTFVRLRAQFSYYRMAHISASKQEAGRIIIDSIVNYVLSQLYGLFTVNNDE